MKKKVFVCVVCIMMTVCMCHTAYATVEVDPNGFGTWIRGWVGSGQVSILRGFGPGKELKVGTNIPESGNDIWMVEDVGNNEYVIYSAPDCYVNIYRVLQNNSYYLCTGFRYENETGGQDQRVKLLQHKNVNPPYTIIQLAHPAVGGSWYMMADYSQPVPSSSVVWYTNPNLVKARWG